jgi:hypothetical protein
MLASLPLAILAAVLLVTGRFRDEAPDPPPPPPAAILLRGSLTVWVWSADRGRQLRIAPDPQEGALPVREDDRIQIEGELNQPAQVYLLWIDAAGYVTPLYPWNDPSSAGDLKVKTVDGPLPASRPVRSFSNPSRPGVGYQADDTAGLDTLLMLARRNPWPRDYDLGRQIGSLPDARIANDTELVIRSWSNTEEVDEPTLRLDRNRGPKAGSIDDQLVQVVQRLYGDFDFIHAIRFAHVKSQPD